MTPNALLSAGVLIHFGEPDWNLKSLVNAARCPLKGGDCCLVILTPGFYLGRRRAQPGPHPNRLAGALQALPEVPGGNPLYRGVSPSFDDSHGLGGQAKCLGRGWQCQQPKPFVCHRTPDGGTVYLLFSPGDRRALGACFCPPVSVVVDLTTRNEPHGHFS